MYARSKDFDAAIRYSHVPVFRADVLLGGTIRKTGLYIIGGRVNVDGSAAIRRRGSLTVVDPDGSLTPNDPSDALSPYGNELRIYRGIRLPTLDELIPIATLRIRQVGSEKSPRGRLITVTGFDRASSVQRARFESPYTIAAGTNVGTAIRNLLDSRLAGLTYDFITTTATTPLLVFDQGSDPWAAAQQMASSIGCKLYFDPTGVCKLQPVPSIDAASSVWDYSTPVAPMLLHIENLLDDDPGYNGAVVDGEAPDVPPVHSVAYDTDPTSPTYSAGPYGKVPEFQRSTMIKTQAQADAARDAMLRAKKGGTQQKRIVTIPHPAHEADDVVHVADTDLGVNAYVRLDAFPMPLDVRTAMEGTTSQVASVAA